MSRYNRKLFVSLVIIAIAVWSYNITLLFGGFHTKKKRVSTTENESFKTVELFEYKADFDDPFFCKAFMAVKEKPRTKTGASKKARKKVAAVKLPKCRISGIVYNPQKPMVMLDHNGKKLIAKEGDIIDSMRISKIYPDSVRIIYKGKRFYLKK